MKSLQKTEEDTLKVLRLAVEGAAEKHRRMGVPMVVWKNGKTTEILPKKPAAPANRRKGPKA